MLPAGYRIRALRAEDASAMAEAYLHNREHLRPWDPMRSDQFFTVEGQRSAIAGTLVSASGGQSVAWVIVHGGSATGYREREQIVGRVNLNNVVRGVMRSASVGYWVDREHLRRGLAREAVTHACVEALALGLHRVEAGTLLHNTASQAVLIGSGFEHYGTAPRYLFIDGQWRDHLLFQRLLHDDPLPPS